MRGPGRSSWTATTTLAAGERLVLHRDDISAADFRAHYGLSERVRLFPYDGSLDNGGERLRLAYPALDAAGTGLVHIPLDSLRYDQLDPWPDADASGQSLHRSSLDAYADDPAHWRAKAPTPGDDTVPPPPADHRRIAIAVSVVDGIEAAVDGDAFTAVPTTFSLPHPPQDSTINFRDLGVDN